MHVERTKYTAHYENGFVVAQWISVEMALDLNGSDNTLSALDRSKEIVEQWYKKNNIPFESNATPPGPPSTINVERTSEDVRIANMIRAMYSCTQLDGEDGLFSYYSIASANVETKAVYDLVKNGLVAKESKEILDNCNKFTEEYKEKLITEPVFKAKHDLEMARMAKPKNKK